MITNTTIAGIIIAIILSVGTPVALYIYFRKKYFISFKTVGIGIFTWIFFSQVLEKGLHFIIFQTDIRSYPWIYAFYGALAAGIFEEVGRFISFKLFLKNKTEWRDGVAFGIGHGGIEAIVIGLIGNVQLLVFALMMKAGTLSAKLNGQILIQIQTMLARATTVTTLLGGVERIFAITAHIFFSLIVLYGIKLNKKIYLLYAILLHALMDLFAALYAIHVIKNIIIVEGLLFVFACIALIYVLKFKAMFAVKEK